MKQRTKRRTRRVAVAVAVIAVLGAVVAFRPWQRDSADDGGEPAATPVSTAAVTVGDLTTTVSLDGSVTSAATASVVHRIDGETASATPATSTAAATAGPSGSTTPVALAVVSSDCVTPPVGETSTTVAAPVPTAPVDSAPTTTVDPASTSSTDASTTTTSPTTVAAAPSSTAPCDATTTTTAAPTAGSVPAGTSPSGGLPSGGLPSGGAASATAGAAGGTGSSSTRTTQIVTSVRPAGSTVGLGDVLYTVEGTPVVALRGWLPAWRTLSTSSEVGFDVAQLEHSLVTLGYDPEGALTIDEEFDSDTKAAVERWQEGLGLEPTGEVTLGSVVFLGSEATIASVSVEVGEEIGDGDVVAELATPSQQIVVDVPAEDQQFVSVGTPVEIGEIAGSVTRLRSIESDAGVGVQAVVTPASPIEGASDGAAVTVRITSVAATSVPLVPVEAVASRLDGTYAVQVLESGSARWVTVEIVGAAGQNVGVTGDGIAEGDQVVVPA